MHLQSIVSFRALAILLIVASHSYDLAGVSNVGFMNIAMINFVSGGTSFFVFVSGYMFHHVFYQRFHYKTFIVAKIKFVLVPYLIISSTYVLQQIIRKPEVVMGEASVSKGDGLSEYVDFIVNVIWSGTAFPAFWYIPFIMLVFLLSPLHFRYLNFSSRPQLAILLVAAVAALLVHRPINSVGALHSLIAFTPVYLLGMVCSQYRAKILGASHIILPISLCLGVVVLLCQTQWGYVGNYHKDQIFTFGGLDLMLLQKMCLSVGIFLLLERLSFIKTQSIDWISATSFTTFFLHGWLLYKLPYLDAEALSGLPWVEIILMTLLIAFICIAMAFIAKKLLKKKSRYFLGY